MATPFELQLKSQALTASHVGIMVTLAEISAAIILQLQSVQKCRNEGQVCANENKCQSQSLIQYGFESEIMSQYQYHCLFLILVHSMKCEYLILYYIHRDFDSVFYGKQWVRFGYVGKIDDDIMK